MGLRDSFADLCGCGVLYNEEKALIRLLLCVEQLHAERLLEAGIYTRRCIGTPPVGLHEPLPKQCNLACKNTRTTSDHLRSHAVIWGECTYGILIDFPVCTCSLAGQQLLHGYSRCSVHHRMSREDMRYARAIQSFAIARI